MRFYVTVVLPTRIRVSWCATLCSLVKLAVTTLRGN